MRKLNILPYSPNDQLYLALGISEKRSGELCDMLNGLVKQTMVVSIPELFSSISEFCQNEEELVYCIHICTKFLMDCSWLKAVIGNF